MSAPRLGSSPSQKSWLEDCEDSLATTGPGCELEAVCSVVAGWAVEAGCCANALSAITVDKSGVIKNWFVISFPSERVLFKPNGQCLRRGLMIRTLTLGISFLP